MSRFWQINAAVLFVVFLCFQWLGDSFPWDAKMYRPSLGTAVVVFAAAIALVAVAWAVGFRRQLERGRPSAVALTFLVIMEGCFVGMAWILNPALLPWLQRATP
jgi:uncharacterized membrane protein YhaH (DUF805 family)